MSIRPVNLGDVDQLVTLETAAFGKDGWTRGMLLQELQAPARTYLAYEQEGQVKAYGGFWYDGEDAEIMTLAVRPSSQGRGLGRALFSQLIEKARSQGAHRVLLEVRVDNEPALHLYQSFGFHKLGLRKRYYQPEGIDAYTMALDLPTQKSSLGPVGSEYSKNHKGQEQDMKRTEQ
ncbi:hypothetical protein KIM372_08910 [Bombiscardovia nodaiensis]|uniref:N-acetyltransferase domain-containing protein n=1 Tax=Bombiscardovia nodaiensis TaxID=2932181 RepID=A0ABN6S9X4_9BIFI|nr:hypothetical protein KIM372_08910 [Bombiscardovia nodaiensis]